MQICFGYTLPHKVRFQFGFLCVSVLTLNTEKSVPLFFASLLEALGMHCANKAEIITVDFSYIAVALRPLQVTSYVF